MTGLIPDKIVLCTKGSLYWTESKGYTLSTDFQMVGTIKEMVDKVPVENFASAKSSAGSKIYIKKEDLKKTK